MRNKVLLVSIITILISSCAIFNLFNKNNDETCDYCYKRNEKAINLSNDIYVLLTNGTKEELPDFYGGDYISNDGNYLVVQIVKDKIPTNKVNITPKDKEESDLYQKLIKYDKNIIFEYVNHPYTELERVDAFVKDYFDKVPMTDFNVTTIGIAIMKNKVEIGLSKNTEENRQKFKENVIDSDVIEFVESNPTIY